MQPSQRINPLRRLIALCVLLGTLVVSSVSVSADQVNTTPVSTAFDSTTLSGYVDTSSFGGLNHKIRMGLERGQGHFSCGSGCGCGGKFSCSRKLVCSTSIDRRSPHE
jgi:hypothetical protein